MSEPIIEYRAEFNVMDLASKYAERVSRVIDEQTLANVEHQLARYGYVKVVRCHDCRYVNHIPNWQPDKRFKPKDIWICESEWCMGLEGDHPLVEPDGFCKWGKRRSE